ncbi:hypothetical protein QQF64_015176 [Cirrhinus molitorella]|uniref:Immunoglobulin V-set domain-containing protein n=1 Tax=Cirrhinus molitorella TaxID=172907 RepID=A0ABR3NUY0_9TELE
MILFAFILLFSFAGSVFGDVITPVHNEVYKTEKDIISLSCNYSSAASLYWYQQYSGSPPEFLLVILHATGKVLQKSKVVELDPRYSGKLNKEKTHTYLEISSAKMGFKDY